MQLTFSSSLLNYSAKKRGAHQRFPRVERNTYTEGQNYAELYASWRKNTTRGALSNEKYHGKFHGTVARDV